MWQQGELHETNYAAVIYNYGDVMARVRNKSLLLLQKEVEQRDEIRAAEKRNNIALRIMKRSEAKEMLYLYAAFLIPKSRKDSDHSCQRYINLSAKS